MERKTFDDCMGWLVKFHGKQNLMTAAALESYWTHFQNEHDEVFCKAALLAEEKQGPGQFPSIERMRSLVVLAREELHKVQKAAEPKRPLSRPAPDLRNVPRGIADFGLVMRLCNGGYSEATLQELEKRWPVELYGINWQAEAVEAARVREARLPEFLINGRQ